MIFLLSYRILYRVDDMEIKDTTAASFDEPDSNQGRTETRGGVRPRFREARLDVR